MILTGGRGGNGNQHYATSTMQAPRYAQPGQPAKELNLFLELKVIADVGLVGFPNVGKSTFLSRVTNARPKIANYHFTTLSPNLGVVDLGDGQGFVIADIPGLIEGASEGVGLGFEFLRHIERCRVLIHMVDAAGTEGRDPVDDIKKIMTELESYSPEIAKRPQIIAANKMDVYGEIPDIGEDESKDEALYEGCEIIKKLRDEFSSSGIEVVPISAVSGKNIDKLIYKVKDLLDSVDKEPLVFKSEFDPNEALLIESEPFTVEYDEKENEYVIEGPRIEKMLGYTNIESEKGFIFFQKFLKDNGILDRLEKLGIKDGDTVRMYGLSFDYYK